MGFNLGIVGLPNVGKSTLFNALTTNHVPAENYPFCTTDHHVGIVNVPDNRLLEISEIFKPERIVPTTIEFIDIAGLVEGAHKGEGLGNKFLGHIRNVDAIAQVIRCFDDPNVIHQYENIDPVRDYQIINTEILLADLETVQKRIEKTSHLARTGNKEAKNELAIYEKLVAEINKGNFINKLNLSDDETSLVSELCLITAKPMFIIANVSESDLTNKSKHLQSLLEKVKDDNLQLTVICSKLESELNELTREERVEFLKNFEERYTGLEKIISAGYKILDLITFFTKDGPEVRAWTVKKGTKAPKAAGKIHSDFENKFIRAEIYNYDELVEYKDEHNLRANGKIRIEGKDYILKDGDIMHIKI